MMSGRDLTIVDEAAAALHVRIVIVRVPGDRKRT
jgi:hypothetical protein